jgi:cardiolipin synthase
MLITILSIVFGLWVLGLTVFILLERRPPAATLGWIIALTFLPYIGLPVYLYVGPRRWNRKKRHLASARAVIGEELRERLERANQDVQSLLPQDDARLIQLGTGLLTAAAARAREVTLYHEGVDFYAALIEAVAAAERHIHLEFYIWRADQIGARLRDALAAKARQGVEVRVLVDAVGSPKFRKRFVQPLLDAGAEVAWFNAPKWIRVRPQLVNFRTHRKIVVIDGELAFTGGMNIADYHSSEFVGEAAQRDTHVRILGLPASWLQLVFLENWHFANGDGPNHLDYISLDGECGDELVQIAASGPDTDFATIHKLFLEAIHGAKQRLWLSTPYFVPDEAITMALQSAALRGVDVCILVPEKNDQRLVRAASRTYYDELLEAGVRIHEFEPRMHHAKTMIADDDLAIVGTANIDNRSFRLNFEVIAVLYGHRAQAELAERYEQDLAQSRAVALGEEGRHALPVRIFDSIARLLSPLL